MELKIKICSENLCIYLAFNVICLAHYLLFYEGMQLKGTEGNMATEMSIPRRSPGSMLRVY